MVTLAEVKQALGVSGTDLDATLQPHFDAVMAYLKAGGATDETITAGLVMQGVRDLWNYTPGSGKFSQTFEIMANQAALRARRVEDETI